MAPDALKQVSILAIKLSASSLEIAKTLERELADLQEILKTHFDISVCEMDRDARNRHRLDLLVLKRTPRGRQDPTSFILYFNPILAGKFPKEDLRHRAFHELLHAMTWRFTDEFQSLLRTVKNEQLKKELSVRFYETREAITYDMERSFIDLVPKIGA